PGHPLWSRLVSRGFEARLRAIADAPCPPDIIGINHYLTSDRFIDHRLDRYDGIGPAAESRGHYVNVEAVRTLPDGPIAVGRLLRHAWGRYGRTIAITECHNGCTREE